MQNESAMGTPPPISSSLTTSSLIQVQREFQNSLFDQLAENNLPTTTFQMKKDRLNVYQRSYIARILASLEEDFPWLLKVLSESKFNFWMKNYISTNPSTYYTLAEASRGVSDYLLKSFPDRPWLAELARLEWLYCETAHVRYAEEWEEARFDWPAFFSKTEPEKIFSVKLQFCPTIRFFHSKWSFDEFLEHDGASFSFDWELPEKEYFAVIHRSDVTHSERYEKEEWHFLRYLHEGFTIEEAVEMVSTIDPAELQAWFQHWIKERIVVGVISA